jgi:hypothetical protein
MKLGRDDDVIAAPEPNKLLLLLEALRGIEECTMANPEALLRLLAGEDDLAACKQLRQVRGECCAHIASCSIIRISSGDVNTIIDFSHFFISAICEDIQTYEYLPSMWSQLHGGLGQNITKNSGLSSQLPALREFTPWHVPVCYILYHLSVPH